eukprot:2248529-Pyramimonas_sp.AAC.1
MPPKCFCMCWATPEAVGMASPLSSNMCGKAIGFSFLPPNRSRVLQWPHCSLDMRASAEIFASPAVFSRKDALSFSRL